MNTRSLNIQAIGMYIVAAGYAAHGDGLATFCYIVAGSIYVFVSDIKLTFKEIKNAR